MTPHGTVTSGMFTSHGPLFSENVTVRLSAWKRESFHSYPSLITNRRFIIQKKRNYCRYLYISQPKRSQFCPREMSAFKLFILIWKIIWVIWTRTAPGLKVRVVGSRRVTRGPEKIIISEVTWIIQIIAATPTNVGANVCPMLTVAFDGARDRTAKLCLSTFSSVCRVLFPLAQWICFSINQAWQSEQDCCGLEIT